MKVMDDKVLEILNKMSAGKRKYEEKKAKKQGFSSPDASWFKGESIDFVKSKIMDDNAPIYSFLDASMVRKISEKHFSGTQHKRLFIWSVINVNQYLKDILT